MGRVPSEGTAQGHAGTATDQRNRYVVGGACAQAGWLNGKEGHGFEPGQVDIQRVARMSMFPRRRGSPALTFRLLPQGRHLCPRLRDSDDPQLPEPVAAIGSECRSGSSGYAFRAGPCSPGGGTPFASGSTPRRSSSDRMIGVTVNPCSRIERRMIRPTIPHKCSTFATGM